MNGFPFSKPNAMINLIWRSHPLQVLLLNQGKLYNVHQKPKTPVVWRKFASRMVAAANQASLCDMENDIQVFNGSGHESVRVSHIDGNSNVGQCGSICIGVLPIKVVVNKKFFYLGSFVVVSTGELGRWP